MATINYKLIKNFFSSEELNLLQKYCYNKLDRNTDYEIDEEEILNDGEFIERYSINEAY